MTPVNKSTARSFCHSGKFPRLRLPPTRTFLRLADVLVVLVFFLAMVLSALLTLTTSIFIVVSKYFIHMC